jgi:hypothetical protein
MADEADMGQSSMIEKLETSSYSSIASAYASYPRVDKKFDYNNPERSARDILPSIFPEYFPNDLVSERLITVTTVCGGITNKLFRCEISPEKDDNSQTSRVVLVRVFGAEGLIDRELETMQFLALFLAGLGPPYHGRFANGRVEGFYEDCRTLTPLDLSKPDLSRKIAIQMAK